MSAETDNNSRQEDAKSAGQAPAQQRPKFGIVTPLANEENTIRDLIGRILVHLLPHDRIYCVLDKMCKDNTKAIIAEMSAKDPRVVLIWAPENRCVVDAYFRGYRAAFEDGCEWILEMDGGCSHLPEEIPQFIRGMEQGYDYVGGSRFMPGGTHKSPFTRVFVSKGGSLLTNWLLKTQMKDMTSGFECFNRRAMEMVLKNGVASRANFFQTEIRYMMHQLRWLEVPIHYSNDMYRIGRSSLRESFRILWNLYRAKKASAPTSLPNPPSQ
jgi:dolichol-phosphate mannosyltransferase